MPTVVWSYQALCVGRSSIDSQPDDLCCRLPHWASVWLGHPYPRLPKSLAFSFHFHIHIHISSAYLSSLHTGKSDPSASLKFHQSSINRPVRHAASRSRVKFPT